MVVSSFWGGLPQKVVEAWFGERYILLISPSVLAEYQEVLEELLPGSSSVPRFLHAVYLKAIAVQPKERLEVIRADPDDNRFLECAMAGRADFLVSGDRHLLELKKFRGISILLARGFLEKM